MMRIYGLTGFPLHHSFSPAYFLHKFQSEGITDAAYRLFPIQSIAEIQELLNSQAISGLNVTIPYKESIIPFLDELDEIAAAVGAVNTIRIHILQDGFHLKGYNTDVLGFRDSLLPLLKKTHTHALILGSGGSSKAIAYVLKELGIAYTKISRLATSPEFLSYADLTVEDIANNTLIINTTPAGTAGNPASFPCVSVVPLMQAAAAEGHLFYDLVYNPALSPFLQLGKAKGAVIKNGLEMLQIQAEASWQIWNT